MDGSAQRDPKGNKEAFPFYSSILHHLPVNFLNNGQCHQSQRDPSLLKILSLPARSLLPKINHLRGVCLSESFDVIAVTETWLSLDISDSEVGIPGYSLVRKDRNRHGGGVAIYISTSISYSPLQLQHPDLELVTAECYFGVHLLTIAGFYRPPSSSTDVMSFTMFSHY